MQNGPSEYKVRVAQARRKAVSAPHLEWSERVLLAAAEAAEFCVAPAVQAEVACAIADKAGIALRELETLRGVRVAITDAVASAGLDDRVPAHVVTRLVWRLVFDLWGGPDR
jgi:hypothetical protein